MRAPALVGLTVSLIIGSHVLRHTFCSHLAMRGAAPKAIQELVGHSTLSMTQLGGVCRPVLESPRLELHQHRRDSDQHSHDPGIASHAPERPNTAFHRAQGAPRAAIERA